MKKLTKILPLCYRCEYRAQYLEEGHAPRCECGDVKTATDGCYMYKPVKPLVLEKNDGDDRPQFAGAMISARSHAVGIADCELNLKEGVLYWIPKGKNKLPLDK